MSGWSPVHLLCVGQDFVGKLVFNIGDKEDFSYNLEDYDLDLPEKKDIGVGVKVRTQPYVPVHRSIRWSLWSLCSWCLPSHIMPSVPVDILTGRQQAL